MKYSAIAFTALTIFLFGGLIMYPVAAEEFETEVHTTYYWIPYGNGKDDNEDGVIDDANESDVKQGNIPMNYTGNVFDDWNYNFTYRNVEKGVQIGAIYENEAVINSSISINPVYSCYSTNWDATFIQETKVIPILQFYVKISPKILMNGAQEIWYRSPLKWDWDKYGDGHFLNIFDESDNLVYASENVLDDAPEPKIVDNRSYFKLNMNFRTEKKYRFVEYIRTKDDLPINNVHPFFANYQDIGNDNLIDSYIFPETNYTKKIEIELSWSIICTIGIGRVGTEKLIIGNSTNMNINIKSQKIVSSDPNEMNQIRVIIPIRTTTPLNISCSVDMWSGDNSSSFAAGNYPNVTGTFIANISFPQPEGDLDPTKPNTYQITLIVHNFSDPNEAMTYVMYPCGGAIHTIDFADGIGYTVFNHFAMNVELYEMNITAGTTKDESTHDPNALLGWGLIVAGLILTMTLIGVEVGIPLMIAGYTIAAGLMIAGTLIVVEGPSIDILEALKNYILRAGRAIYEGLKWIGEQLYNLGLWIYEKAVQLGKAIAYYGAIILKGFTEILYLVLFILAIYLWVKFLSWMRLIARGKLKELAREVEKTWTSWKGGATATYKKVRRR